MILNFVPTTKTIGSGWPRSGAGAALFCEPGPEFKVRHYYRVMGS